MRFLPPRTKLRKWWPALFVPVAALLIAGKMTNTSPPTNLAQTAPDATPGLRTRIYSQSQSEVYQAARAVAGEQKTWFKSWRVAPPQDGQSQIKAEVFVLMFTDDLTIDIDTQGEQTRVNVQSKSRVGQGDFGENRRHIAQFLTALDERLKIS